MTTETYYGDSCTEEVARLGELQPCDKTAVAVRRDPEGDYAVCAFHARGPMVPLAELLSGVRS